MSRHSLILIVFAAVLLATASTAAQTAEDRGYSRVQGRAIEKEEEAPSGDPQILLDMREEMRQFVQSISTFAHKHRRNFLIIVKGGLDLIVKKDDLDENRFPAARTFIQSIDGVLQEGLFLGERPFGQPPPEERQQRLLHLTETAKKHGLKVFVMDFSTDPAAIEKAYQQNKPRGYIPLVAQKLAADIDALPTHPKQPIDENPKSVLSINGIKNFVYIANSRPFGRQDEFALKMKQTNYDMIIVDVFHGRQPLTKRAIETLKYKGIGGKRLVLAYVNIGSAASYRYYWKANWSEGSPSWIDAPFRDDPDRHHVHFWDMGWQKIITGDPKSYIYGVIDQGFDGVVLDGIDAFWYFEGGGEVETQEAAQ